MHMNIRRMTVGVTAIALLIGVTGCGRGVNRDALDERAAWAQQLAAAIPAHLATGRIVVVANPFIDKSGVPADVRAYHRSCLAGLEQGLGRRLGKHEVAFPALREGAWENPQRLLIGKHTTTPLSHLMKPNAFDLLRQEHPDALLFISIVGVPEDFHLDACWTDPDGPALALFLPDFRMIPDPQEWVQAFEQGRVLAAVRARAGQSEAELIHAGNAHALLARP